MDYFDKIVCANQIKNCSITSKDINNAKVIFGTHIAGVRGKIVRCTPKWVDSNCVEILRESQLLHKSVTLVSNVLFVNGIPFFYYAIQEDFFCDCRPHAI